MDGEVAQVQGFGEFLAQYNLPPISGIVEENSLEYVAYCLKSCVVHFQRQAYFTTERLHVDVSQPLR
jgi:hypothetical protein